MCTDVRCQHHCCSHSEGLWMKIEGHQERSREIAWVVAMEVEEGHSVGAEVGRRRRKECRKTHASTISSATTATDTASIHAVTLCESANTAADVVAEDAFVAGVGHGYLELDLG